jgi:hypothetical protein
MHGGACERTHSPSVQLERTPAPDDVKLTFIVVNEYLVGQVMEFLTMSKIDYYTRWDHVKGKGRGTEPHLGSGSFASTNSVLMIAFDEEAPLKVLLEKIGRFNAAVARPDDRVRLFQVPLELLA